MTTSPVPMEDLRTVVELGGLAPSVHNTQSWRFSWNGPAVEVREAGPRAPGDRPDRPRVR